MKEFMTEIARQAGNFAIECMDTKNIRYKGDKDIVTSADLKIENYLTGKILEKYPDHSIISEESAEIKGRGSHSWIIDPIDGTVNYAHKNPMFCISIAHSEDGKVKHGCVFAPAFDEMYFAAKGKGAQLNGQSIHVSDIKDISKAMLYFSVSQKSRYFEEGLALEKSAILFSERVRSIGSLALETCFVSAGRGEAVMRLSEGAKVWDYAAASLILEEAGGKATDFYGSVLDISKGSSNFVATNSSIHAQIINLIKTNFIKIKQQTEGEKK